MESVATFDLAKQSVRDLNQFLHHDVAKNGTKSVRVLNPNGLHSIAVGLDAPVEVEVMGQAGYYLGGMNKRLSFEEMCTEMDELAAVPTDVLAAWVTDSIESCWCRSRVSATDCVCSPAGPPPPSTSSTARASRRCCSASPP